MADSAYDVLVNIDANIQGFNAELARLHGRLGEVGTASTRTGGIISQALSFAGGLGITNMVANLGSKMLEIGKKAIMTASDLQEVQNVVDVTFGAEGSKKIETWANTALNSFGLSELQAKKFGSTMGAMLKSSGLAGDAVIKMSTNLGSLSGDLASFYNIAQQDAFDKLRAGISGETEPLKQLGINMSVANLEALALSLGVKKSYQEMTQAEQVSIRYAYIMKATKDAQGDFARTQDGFANQLRLLTTSFEQLAGRVAGPFLDSLSKGASQLNKLIEVIQSGNFPISAWIEKMGISRETLDKVKFVVDALKLKFDELYARVLPYLKTGFELLEKAAASAWALLKDILKTTLDLTIAFEKNWEKLKPLAVGVAASAASFGLYLIAINLAAIATGIWSTVCATATAITGAFTVVLGVLTSPITLTILAIGALVAAAYYLYTNWDLVVTKFKEFANYMGEVGSNIVKGLWGGISSMSDWIKSKITEFVSGIGSTIKDFFGIASPAKLTIGYGEEVALGIAVGVENETPKAQKAATSLAKKTAKALSDELENNMKESQAFAKDYGQRTISALNNLGNATIEALKKKYSKEEQIQLDSLTKQSENLRRQTSYNIEQYDRELLAKLKTLDDSSSAEIKALQAKMDALDNLTEQEDKALKETEYRETLGQKQQKLTTTDDTKERATIQKEIDELIVEHSRQMVLEQRQIEKDGFTKEIETIRTNAEIKRAQYTAENEAKKASEILMQDFQLASFALEMDRVKEQYGKLNEEESLQATARYLALDANNGELITLLETYYPKWQDAGQSFGEKLIDGINSTKTGIQAAVNEALAMVNALKNAQNEVILAAQSYWNVARSQGNQAGMDAAHQMAEAARRAGGTIPAYAKGTNFASGGMSLVGEFGPELVNLPRGSSVTPNGAFGNISVTVGTLVGSSGMNELVEIISNKMNKKYASAIGGGFY